MAWTARPGPGTTRRTAGADRAQPVFPQARGQADARRGGCAGRRTGRGGGLAAGAAGAQPDGRPAAFGDPSAGRRRARRRGGAARGRHHQHQGGGGGPTRRRRHGGGGLPVPAPRHRGAVRDGRRAGVRRHHQPRHRPDRRPRRGAGGAGRARPRRDRSPAAPGDPGGRGDRHQRQDHHHPADRAPGQGRRPDARLVLHRRHLHRRRGSRDRRLVRSGRRGPGARGSPGAGRGHRNRARRDPAARRRNRRQRRLGGHQHQRRPPGPARRAHHRAVGRGQVGGRPDHQAERLDRAERRRSAGQGDALGLAGTTLVLLAGPGEPLPGRGAGGGRAGDHRPRRADRDPRPRQRPDRSSSTSPTFRSPWPAPPG